VQPRKLITAPVAEPLTVTEAKLHLQVEHTAEDTLITSLIQASREHIEKVCSRALMAQTWDVYFPCFPWGNRLVLPLGNLQSVSAFEWTDSTGAPFTWTVSGLNLLSGTTTMAHIDTVSEPAEIRLAFAMTWPTTVLKTVNPIRVRIVCGWTDSASVPESIKSAMKLQIAHLYNNRADVIVGDSAAVDSKVLAKGVDSLLANYRLY
jgi:uncharacterized phiE125 gp8 family phage protein